MCFLAMKIDVITHGLYVSPREGVIMHLDLLQADNIGLMSINQRLQLRQPGT